MANFFDQRAEDLAERSEPGEALAALRQLDGLTDTQLDALDLCLAHWLVPALSRPGDVDGIVELQQLCELAQGLIPETAAARVYAARWQGFHDLLEGKRVAIHTRQSAQRPALLQEPAILERLANFGEVTQRQLAQDLQLSAGRISQLLSALEAQGKVTRSKRGRESIVSLGAQAPRAPVIPVAEIGAATGNHSLIALVFGHKGNVNV